MCFTKLTKSDIFFVIYILLILHLGSICGSAILTLCDRSIPTSLVMPAFWIKTEGLRNIHELRLRVNRGFTLLHSLFVMYSLHTWKECRFGQRHGLQDVTLTSYFYKNIYRKVIYLYFYECIFQDKFIHMIFVFWNSTA